VTGFLMRMVARARGQEQGLAPRPPHRFNVGPSYGDVRQETPFALEREPASLTVEQEVSRPRQSSRPQPWGTEDEVASEPHARVGEPLRPLAGSDALRFDPGCAADAAEQSEYRVAASSSVARAGQGVPGRDSAVGSGTSDPPPEARPLIRQAGPLPGKALPMLQSPETLPPREARSIGQAEQAERHEQLEQTATRSLLRRPLATNSALYSHVSRHDRQHHEHRRRQHLR
jgi:hypothetical protein